MARAQDAPSPPGAVRDADAARPSSTGFRTRERVSRVGALGATVGFIVAVSEMLVMSGPFAAYFYGAYSPFLQLLQRSEHTMWLSQFWLIHTRPRPLLELLEVLGIALAFVGVGLFTMHAGYLYAVKFRRRGVALRFLYRWVRHPQYACLIVAGLGFTVLWPRFINLVLFVAMSAAYVALARIEERRMQRSHADVYRSRMLPKPTFFPGAPGAWLERRLLNSVPEASRAWLLVTLLGGATLGAAFALRVASINTLHFVSIPGAAHAQIVAHDATPSSGLVEALGALAAETPRVPQLFYVVASRAVAEHLLVDSGIRNAHDLGSTDMAATIYVVRARIVRANGEPAGSVTEARGLRVRRALDGVYAGRTVEGRVQLSELPSLRTLPFAHSNVPLL